MVYETQNHRVSVPVIEVSSSKGPNRVGVSLPSPKDANRSSLQNVVVTSNSGRRAKFGTPLTLRQISLLDYYQAVSACPFGKSRLGSR
jgi:hypothetical protein